MELYKRGSRGEMVKQIQKSLYGAGYPCGMIDGIYGASTEEAVIAFQRGKGLKTDGIVGPATLALLIPCRFKRSKRRIDEIIIHCTATPDGRECSVAEIRKWHKQRGFSDIGYHYVIHIHGELDLGRDVDISGAHCTGHNSHSIGVVYVGGLTSDGKKAKDTRTLRQKAVLLSLLYDLRKLYPTAKIIGHRDTSPDKNGNGIVEPSEWIKACPCFDAMSEYRSI